MFILVLLATLSSPSVERDVLANVNRYRVEHKLAPLEWSEPAAEEARGHCRQLLSGPVTAPHAGFDSRLARLRRKVNFRAAAENVGLMSLSSKAAETLVGMWSRSDTHRRNLEGPFAQSGIGVVQSNGMICATQLLLQ